MFRLYDAATGQPGPVPQARPGELRIWVAAPATHGAGLRRCLVADLLRRVAERHHLLVRTWYQAPDPGTGTLADLNIYPAEFAAAPPQPLDVAVAREPATSAETPAANWLRPGEAETADASGLDPLALRLALLERPYREPVSLGRDALEAADKTLRHWRGLVADWANSPSKPMCARYTGDVYAALDNDLDTPAAVRTMHALAAADGLPPGSRFEGFAHLDQLLGLDLARDVGR